MYGRSIDSSRPLSRRLAVAIALAIIAFALRVSRDVPNVLVLRRLSILWLVLVFVQLTLGAWVIWSNKAVDIATTHVAVGAIMLSFGVSIYAICRRILPAHPNARSATHPIEQRGTAVA